MSAPIVLVPGWWLGAWAWDEVAASLRADGHEVTAVTLPGLESADADRSSITMEDHVRAIVDAVRAAGERVVLAVHSGAGAPGYAASDRVPELIAAMVYVDTGPAKGVLDEEGPEGERPMPSFDELRASGENLDGITPEQLEVWRERAVPEPGAAYREAAELTNDGRLYIPSTVICTSMTSDDVKGWIEEGYPFIAGLGELRKVVYVDLPTSHWPMFSEPEALARTLGDVAARHGRA
jgi:pimeloyl-ACP methyl ester carboxylesterase